MTQPTCAIRLLSWPARWLGLALCLATSPLLAVDFQAEVLPILTKYCAGCHNAQDREGELSLQSYADLQAGGEHGVVVVAGDSAASRLIQLLIGQSDPRMPPEDEPRPDDDQISLLRRWIDEGASPGGDGQPSTGTAPPQLNVPQLDPSPLPKPITALAFSPDGQRLAVGRYQTIDLVTPERQFVQQFAGHPGKINAVGFSPDGRWLLAATGITGLLGETWVWDVRRGQVARKLAGHDDAVYALALSPNGKRLATAGYDRKIVIWDFAGGQPQRTLLGHNGAVFDLAFAPNSRVLASASADATVKVWDVESGQRLDTLSQPLKEQYSVDISPDGQLIAAGGADNRVRIWRLLSIDQPQINPLLEARYAHEQPIQRVRFSPDGRKLVSVSADRTTKLWDVGQLRQIQVRAQQGDVAETLAWQPGTERVFVGRMDGGLEVIETHVADTGPVAARPVAEGLVSSPSEGTDVKPIELAETEPNDHVQQAEPIALPARIRGSIYHADGPRPDVDMFRFRAQQGETWMIEVRAARDGSPLDSVVRVLDEQGRPVPRLLLRAVRDSYFTFRGKDSTQTGDFRLHNWEEMTLNQYLYASGEVVKLYHYPRGPDSGFNVYPNFGNRHGFFDTTPVTHPLGEPCYIVEPYAPGTELPANGLPVFTLAYENDDESQRRWDRDSLLTFTAPSDGQYVVALEDVREFQGEKFTYELLVRAPRPDFHARMLNNELQVPQGSGSKFGVELERIDGFAGAVTIEFEGLPEGLRVSGPLVIEPGQLRAWGTLYTQADREAPVPSGDATARVFATAEIAGRTVRHALGEWGPLKVREAAKINIDFVGNQPGTEHIPSVLEIVAGTTTTAQIRIQRHGEAGRVSFGSEEAVVNAPHGVYVGNIGLNGVLITEAENERTVFLHAEPWVEPGERLVFVEAGVDGSPTSRPILLRVVRPSAAVARQSGE